MTSLTDNYGNLHYLAKGVETVLLGFLEARTNGFYWPGEHFQYK